MSAQKVGTFGPRAEGTRGQGLMNVSRRPTRTWWMKRHDTVNLTVLAVIILFILWTTFR
jgi:hypothetical protein